MSSAWNATLKAVAQQPHSAHTARTAASDDAAKQPAAHQTGAAKRRQRHGDGARVDVRDLRQERLDIAVTRVVAGRHEHRDRVERDKERVLEQLGQLLNGKAPTRRHGREHRCLVHHRGGRKGPDHGKRHAPAHGQADGAADRQAKDLCDGRARSDHADGKRPVTGVDQARGHDRGDRPEHGMCASDHQARTDQDGICRCHSGQELTQRKHGEHAEQHPLELKARGKHHEWQRQQHDAPSIDRDHDACLGLGERERRGDISQKADGHKLRRVEHERTAGEPDEREPLPERDAVLPCLTHI